MAKPAIIDCDTATFQASAALAAHIRVDFDGNGKLQVAAADDVSAGITEAAAAAADDFVGVRLKAAPSGIYTADGSAPIAAGNIVYGAASGKVTPNSGGERIGLAVTAGTSDGDLVTVLHN